MNFVQKEKQQRFDDVKHMLRYFEAVLEMVLLVIPYYFMWKGFYRDLGAYPYYGMGKYLLAFMYIFLLCVLLSLYDGFNFGHLKMLDILLSQWIVIIIANAISYFQVCLLSNGMVVLYPMILLTILDGLIAFVCVYAFTRIYHSFYVPRKMLMIIGTESAVTLKIKMDTRTDKYCVNKILPITVGIDAIAQAIPQYDAVVINDVPAEIRNDILKFCYEKKVRTYLAPKVSDIILRGAKNMSLFDTPLLLVKGEKLTLEQRIVKRSMDIILSLLALIIAGPIMLIVALAIKVEDGGPVFFKQERVTKDKKNFNIIKFRSMVVDAEKEGISIPATEKDPRITKVGHFIRKTRIDELPQIINILLGDMSIVGPRPERVEHIEQYCAEIPEFEYRLMVKGGLTGYAQIFGKYNTSAYDKLRLDLMYIENYSLLLDIKIIFMTLRVMLKSESTEGFDVVIGREKIKEQILQEVAVASEQDDVTDCMSTKE